MHGPSFGFKVEPGGGVLAVPRRGGVIGAGPEAWCQVAGGAARDVHAEVTGTDRGVLVRPLHPVWIERSGRPPQPARAAVLIQCGDAVRIGRPDGPRLEVVAAHAPVAPTPRRVVAPPGPPADPPAPRAPRAGRWVGAAGWLLAGVVGVGGLPHGAWWPPRSDLDACPPPPPADDGPPTLAALAGRVVEPAALDALLSDAMGEAAVHDALGRLAQAPPDPAWWRGGSSPVWRAQQAITDAGVVEPLSRILPWHVVSPREPPPDDGAPRWQQVGGACARGPFRLTMAQAGALDLRTADAALADDATMARLSLASPADRAVELRALWDGARLGVGLGPGPAPVARPTIARVTSPGGPGAWCVARDGSDDRDELAVVARALATRLGGAAPGSRPLAARSVVARLAALHGPGVAEDLPIAAWPDDLRARVADHVALALWAPCQARIDPHLPDTPPPAVDLDACAVLLGRLAASAPRSEAVESR